jgi:alpha-1,2-mannosyltransferase
MSTLHPIPARVSTLTRSVFLFLLLNIGISNLPMIIGSADMTVLHYTGAFFDRVAYNDSWVPMRQALEYLHTPAIRESFSNRPLYTVLFFDQKVKFQYPPTSLLFLEPLRLVSPDGFIHDDLLNTISWIGILGMIVMVWRILLISFGQFPKLHIPSGIREKLILGIISVMVTLTFYPLLKAFVLGQVQVWIDVLFTGMILAWIKHRKKLSGVLGGIICVIKPQLLLVLLWGILRKQKKFTVALVITVIFFSVISLWVYGIENNLDYISTASYMAQRGESYFPNQTVNGLLNRMLFNGNNLEWVARSFPPYHAVVYWGTILSSLALIGFALFWRRKEFKHSSVVDFSLAMLSFTIASPIAWEHHYGILLPTFALVIPAIASEREHHKYGLIILAGIYFLTSNFFQVADNTAPTYFNFLQSYLFFGAIIFLVYLFKLRRILRQAS